MKIINIIVLIFICLSISGQSTYYVAKNGNNSNPGSITEPFLTITHGAAQLTAGDTLYIRNGTYVEAVSLSTNGTSDNRIVISGYQNEVAVIDGEYTLPGGSVYSFLVRMSGDYITLANLTLKRTSGGLMSLSGDYTHAINIIGDGARESGLIASGDNNIIDGCSMTDNGNGYQINGQSTWGAAIGTVGSNTIIQNCTSTANRGEGLNSYGTASNVIIQDNTTYNNRSVGLYVDSSSGVIVRRNTVYCTHGEGYNSGIVIGGETGTPSDVTITNNLVYGNWLNLMTDSNVTTAYNWLIANNTFVNSQKTSQHISNGYNMGVYFRVQLVNFVNSFFVNNIIVEEGTNQIPINVNLTNPHDGFTFSHNLWNISPTATAQGTGDVVGDPLFDSTYRLFFNSPAHDAGTDVGLPYNGAAPDIGAYEFTPAEAPALPDIATGAIIKTGNTTVTVTLNLTYDGGGTILGSGVCWSTSEDPTTSDSKTEEGEQAGIFTTDVTGLVKATTYYFRAYATNSLGTSYGENVVYSTPAVIRVKDGTKFLKWNGQFIDW